MRGEARRPDDRSGGVNQKDARTTLASLAALGSILAASSCCWPLLPFMAAVGFAGSSAFLLVARPYLHSLFTASIRHEAQKSAGASQALLLLSCCGSPQHSW